MSDPLTPSVSSSQERDTLVQLCRRCGRWYAMACVDSLMAKTMRRAVLMTTAEAVALGRGCVCNKKEREFQQKVADV